MSAVSLLARAPLVVSRPHLAAADSQNDALFVARAALRRAISMRASADLQVDQLRALVARLESGTRPRP